MNFKISFKFANFMIRSDCFIECFIIESLRCYFMKTKYKSLNIIIKRYNQKCLH